MIKFIYYYKTKQNSIQKISKQEFSWLELLKVLELDKKKDIRGVPYLKGITPQLLEIKHFLMDVPNPSIIQCYVFVNGELLYI